MYDANMRTTAIVALVALAASPAAAQVHHFEKTLPAEGLVTLDVLTERGGISIVAGPPGQVVVGGTARVRIGWAVPEDADALARATAAAPPITTDGSTLVLRPPADPRARDAVTLGYEVRVPPAITVVVHTDSGAVSIAGVTRNVSVESGSGSIALRDLGADLEVRSGSGAVSAEGVGGSVKARTDSGMLRFARVGASFKAETGSGAVNATFTGPGDVDVRTRSSGVSLDNVDGGLRVETGSGRVLVSGRPQRPWQITTSSSAVDLSFAPDAAATLDVASRSGNVRLEGLDVAGTIDKRRVAGAVGTGGPSVHVRSGSGSIRLKRTGA
jgi:hypothetical protein